MPSAATTDTMRKAFRLGADGGTGRRRSGRPGGVSDVAAVAIASSVVVLILGPPARGAEAAGHLLPAQRRRRAGREPFGVPSVNARPCGNVSPLAKASRGRGPARAPRSRPILSGRKNGAEGRTLLAPSPAGTLLSRLAGDFGRAPGRSGCTVPPCNQPATSPQRPDNSCPLQTNVDGSFRGSSWSTPSTRVYRSQAAGI